MHSFMTRTVRHDHWAALKDKDSFKLLNYWSLPRYFHTNRNKRMPHFVFFFCLVFYVCVVQGKTVETVSNPHAPSSSCKCAAQTINLMNIISAPGVVQPDTFLGIESVKVASTILPVYMFKQPDRLNPQQLPFKLILLSSIPTDSLYDLPVDKAQSSDSWFQGYKWSILICTSDCGNPIHIGWRFESLSDHSSSFYALIAKTNDENSLQTGLSPLEALRDAISVGVPAPAWMIALLASQVSKVGL